MMNTTIKHLLFTVLLTCCHLSAWSQTFVEGYLKYTVIGDKTVEVTGWGVKETRTPKDLTIPATVNYSGVTYTVESIGSKAFDLNKKYYYNVRLEQAHLPNTIKVIGEGAFEHCTNLHTINFPSSLKIIKRDAFSQTAIREVRFPVGLQEIEDYAFYKCKELKSISFPPSLEVIRPWAFSHCDAVEQLSGFHKGIQWSFIKDNMASMAFDYPLNNKIKSPELTNTFSYQYAHDIYKAIVQWQKKKPYETTSQWTARVTQQNREKALQDIVGQFRDEYIREMGGKTQPTYKVELYDKDYQVYPVSCEALGTCYVQVPKAESAHFKESFASATKTPLYGVKNDNLAIIGLTVQIGQKTYKTPQDVADDGSTLAMELPPLEFNLNQEQGVVQPKVATYDKTLDEQIPQAVRQSPKTFVVAIGNENYQLVPAVQFAGNDLDVFARYCQKTLGVPMPNIRKYKDATFGMMLSAISDLKDIAEAYNGDINVIFYYAGHGIPGEQDKAAYLLPVDADGKQTEVCLPVARLYQELADLNTQNVVVMLDACFSGSQRGQGMLASARGVAIKVKDEPLRGNMVVLTAASGTETAYPYAEKGHGLFTYFLLKKLQETRGECTLGELATYVGEQVKRQSVVANRKAQTPSVMASPALSGKWQNMPLTDK